MAEGRTNAGGGGFNKSVIIVTAPTGSTVTCTKGTTVKTAREKDGEWWFKNLDIGEWTLKAMLSGQTATQTVNITQFGVYRVSITYRPTPEFTYTGSYDLVDDNDHTISDFSNYKGNWKIKFLTSGTFKVTNMHGWDGRIDLFLVGGGGAGNAGKSFLSGGGGGKTATHKKISISENVNYPIVVGAGGSVRAASGGTTSAFSKTANGGEGGKGQSGGGNGGSGGGQYDCPGGSDGSDGGGGSGGSGQGTTTREFGESGNTLYSGGGGGYKHDGGDGGGGSSKSGEIDGANNLGGGGAGGYLPDDSQFGKGGSGIVIIRNAR